MEVLTKVLSSSGWNRFFELAGTGVATILGYVGVDRLRWGPPQKPST